MTCTLDKFTTYRVKDVVHAGGRNVVHLADAVASCPDGTLNNSQTQVQHGDGLTMRLAWSERLARPVVTVPVGYEVRDVVDPVPAPAAAVAYETADVATEDPPPAAASGPRIGLAAVLGLVALVLVIFALRKLGARRETARVRRVEAASRAHADREHIARSAAAVGAIGVAVGAAAGYAAGSAESEEAQRQRRMRERKRAEEDRQAASAASAGYVPPPPLPYSPSADYSTPTPSYDSGSSSSSSSDSGSSSYSSDSGSSFGSD